jgi:hypothetical protein
MTDKFDELAKIMAQPVTRRTALKRFGVGAAVALLASFGLAPRAQAGTRGPGEPCKVGSNQCKSGLTCCMTSPRSKNGICLSHCMYPA